MIDLAWGHTPALYELFAKTVMPSFRFKDVHRFNDANLSNYLPYEGYIRFEPTFKQFARAVLYLNLDDYHIIPVEGASRAITIVRALLPPDQPIYTRSHYYSKLPALLCQTMSPINHNQATFLELPSNPLGEYNVIPSTIYDLAYFAPHYFPDDDLYWATLQQLKQQNPDALIFSFGKMMGFNSLRLGVLAVKRDDWYYNASRIIGHSTLGVSVLSQMYAMDIMETKRWRRWKKFFRQARRLLSDHRKKLKVVEAAFNITTLDTGVGMFRVWRVPKRFHNYLNQMGIITANGDSMGLRADPDVIIRLNLLKTTEEIDNAVVSMLRLKHAKQ